MTAVAWAVLGATGRLGRALQAALPAGVVVHGLARQPPPLSAPVSAAPHSFVAGHRRDVGRLRAVLDGCDAVLDLCGMDGDDAAALVEAWTGCERPPRRLVLASSLAERRPARWSEHPSGHAALEHEPPPEDDYGQGKRALRAGCVAGLPVDVQICSLLLPQLLAVDDDDSRQRAYLEAALTEGVLRLPGGGTQRPCVVAVETAAAALVALALGAAPDRGGVFQIAPLQQPPQRSLARALLDGAGLEAVDIVEGAWAGPGRMPHAGGEERVDGAPLRGLLPVLPWPDLLALQGAHGRRLAATLGPIDGAIRHR